MLLSAGMIIAANGELVGGQSYQSCTAMAYDAVGNILSKTGVGTYEYPGSAGGRTFRDGPRRIVTPSGAAVPMAYDAAGRLTQKEPRPILIRPMACCARPRASWGC